MDRGRGSSGTWCDGGDSLAWSIAWALHQRHGIDCIGPRLSEGRLRLVLSLEGVEGEGSVPRRALQQVRDVRVDLRAQIGIQALSFNCGFAEVGSLELSMRCTVH